MIIIIKVSNMNHAVILTGGKGTRMQSSLPKQFIKINDKPLFIYTLEKFSSHELIDDIYLVINEEYRSLYEQYLKEYQISKVKKLIPGGVTRQESVYNALKSMKSQDDDIVIIHDGARPLLSKNLITENIRCCGQNQATTISVTHISDTIVDLAYNPLDRDQLLSVQTPQTFIYSQIHFWHKSLSEQGITNLTDDGQLAKRFNAQICYVEGEKTNIKITDQDDLLLLKNYLSEVATWNSK